MVMWVERELSADRIVGIGDYAISNNKNEVIKTFALGSCVAITVYCARANAAGMAHIALPYYDLSGGLGNPKPCYYANTGIPLLLNKISFKYGCMKDDMEIGLFGGANSVRENDMFKIGQRNLEAIKKILKDHGLSYVVSETGGSYSRTVHLEVATGRTKVISHAIII